MCRVYKRYVLRPATLPFHTILISPLPSAPHMPYKTHLTLLEETAASVPDLPVFKVPRLETPDSEEVAAWISISYAQFKTDVETYARYWSRALTANGIATRSVVGLWSVTVSPRSDVYRVLTICPAFDRLGGMTYLDVLHIYGISRAGYVPQLFSLRMPCPDVVYELLAKTGAKALIFDRSYEHIVVDCPVPVYTALETADVDVEGAPLPQMPLAVNGDDIAMIFHTSGSTSGSPKLVPCNYTWLSAMIVKTYHAAKPRNPSRQDVSVWL